MQISQTLYENFSHNICLLCWPEDCYVHVENIGLCWVENWEVIQDKYLDVSEKSFIRIDIGNLQFSLRQKAVRI